MATEGGEEDLEKVKDEGTEGYPKMHSHRDPETRLWPGEQARPDAGYGGCD